MEFALGGLVGDKFFSSGRGPHDPGWAGGSQGVAQLGDFLFESHDSGASGHGNRCGIQESIDGLCAIALVVAFFVVFGSASLLSRGAR